MIPVEIALKGKEITNQYLNLENKINTINEKIYDKELDINKLTKQIRENYRSYSNYHFYKNMNHKSYVESKALLKASIGYELSKNIQNLYYEILDLIIKKEDIELKIQKLKEDNNEIKPYYYEIGKKVLFYWEDEWLSGEIINDYRTHDGIVNVKLLDGRIVWCGEKRHLEFLKEIN